MADIKSNCPAPANAFKEAVCIDAARIYDSCCDRDCLEDLRVYFCPSDQEYVENAKSVRIRSAEVENVFIDVEPVNFNKGYYSCDIIFYFGVTVELYCAPHTAPKVIEGVAYYEKKVILYGSEGSVKTFSNEYTMVEENDPQLKESTNMPKCTVQCVDPVPLSARICELRDCFDNIHCLPRCICKKFGGAIETCCPCGTPTVYATLGLFTIIQLIREVQMLVPVYDFCIPEKQCVDTADHPCDVFKKIKFPTNDFFPPRPCDIDDSCGCNKRCDR